MKGWFGVDWEVNVCKSYRNRIAEGINTRLFKQLTTTITLRYTDPSRWGKKERYER